MAGLPGHQVTDPPKKVYKNVEDGSRVLISIFGQMERETFWDSHFFVWSSWFVFDPSVFLILQVFPSGGGRENLWCLGG